ncbi:MAG: hydroxysqualene dehydroxylase HpnE [Pseudomonadota bacterium]
MADNSPTIFVVGAGLGGLAAALAASKAGKRVRLFEGAGHAGGRCRSFHDRYLDRRIDNGNHFIMSANRDARAYLDRVGASDQLTHPPYALYPFVDLATHERWTLRFTEGPIPFWAFDKKTRIPGTKLSDYLSGIKLAFAGPEQTVTDIVLGGGNVGQGDTDDLMFKRMWEPLTLAVLNTTPAIGQADLLWAVLRRTFALGGQAAIPMTARDGLGTAFVDPALETLRREGVEITFGARLRSLTEAAGRVTGLQFSADDLVVGPEDQVILALPPSRLRQVMPDVDPPHDDASILNVHFKAPGPVDQRALGKGFFLGMLSSDAQWAVIHGDIISLTVSASHAIGMDEVPNHEVADRLWAETCQALKLGDMAYEKVRVIREKRATFDQSPAGVAKRLPARTRHANLWLAGDHTQTGLPATIEGAILSGNKAAGLAGAAR